METEKVTKILTLEEEVRCDNNHTFKSNEVKLIPFNSAQGLDIGDILFIDCNYNIKAGTNAFNSGFVMACPVCNVIHLSGFNDPNENSIKVSGVDNSIPERNLTTEL